MKHILLAAALAAGLSAAPLARAATGAATEPKVLRVALREAETGFDPVRISDLYSRYVTAHIYEALYTYDPLARPFKVKPLTAAAMPEHSPDYKVWTVRIQPGIYFHDDPAFKGAKRELVAQDFVYTYKRYFDPVYNSPTYSQLHEEGMPGLEVLREQALKQKQPFDYDREVEDVKALDRYTIRFTLAKSRPRFIYTLAACDLFGAVAREVIERYGDDSAAHPVGTGAYKLGPWRRSSLIVLERNPAYRERFYDAEPAPDDAEGQAILARLKGRRIPMIDRVELRPIEESQPRWLAFLNGELDIVDPVPPDLASAAIPGGKLAPNLAKRGIVMHKVVNSDVTVSYFNMDDPVVGGYAPEKVALRRAIVMGYDTEREIGIIRRGQGIAAQTTVAPHTYGYDPDFITDNSTYSPPRAKALLDLYGYIDRDGDGWRDQPDGSALVLRMASEPDQLSRQLDEQWRRDMSAIGIRIQFETGKWPEHMKAARAGRSMMWRLGQSSATPDGQQGLATLYGPESGSENLARFRLDAFDALYRQSDAMPDGPERLAVMRQANLIATAYAPYKFHVHRIYADLTQPWVVGYRRPTFWLEQWMYYDIDTQRRQAH
ncbi:ABC transporter substrate-binding protein [Caldimonas sp. KR1-144]|uniref:ABC transporter substrate-binding protein n=1 Tax=Caldimonas sp. KR1-144 TaxID=3400911 RepID=UPI003C0C8640